MADAHGFGVSGSCIDCTMVFDEFENAARRALDRLEDGDEEDFVSIRNVSTNEIVFEVDRYFFKTQQLLQIPLLPDPNTGERYIFRSH